MQRTHVEIIYPNTDYTFPFLLYCVRIILKLGYVTLSEHINFYKP
jgi:hypothetical protein